MEFGARDRRGQPVGSGCSCWWCSPSYVVVGVLAFGLRCWRRRSAPRDGWACGCAGVAHGNWSPLLSAPKTAEQKEYSAVIAIHPPIAWVLRALRVTALASILYLWPRTRKSGSDLRAASSAEISAVFAGLTLVTGSIWGRPHGACTDVGCPPHADGLTAGHDPRLPPRSARAW